MPLAVSIVQKMLKTLRTALSEYERHSCRDIMQLKRAKSVAKDKYRKSRRVKRGKKIPNEILPEIEELLRRDYQAMKDCRGCTKEEEENAGSSMAARASNVFCEKSEKRNLRETLPPILTLVFEPSRAH